MTMGAGRQRREEEGYLLQRIMIYPSDSWIIFVPLPPPEIPFDLNAQSNTMKRQIKSRVYIYYESKA